MWVWDKMEWECAFPLVKHWIQRGIFHSLFPRFRLEVDKVNDVHLLSPQRYSLLQKVDKLFYPLIKRRWKCHAAVGEIKRFCIKFKTSSCRERGKLVLRSGTALFTLRQFTGFPLKMGNGVFEFGPCGGIRLTLVAEAAFVWKVSPTVRMYFVWGCKFMWIHWDEFSSEFRRFQWSVDYLR